MSEMNGSDALFGNDIQHARNIKDGRLKEVTNNLDKLLIEADNEKKEWDCDKIADERIPRIRDRGDRLPSGLFNQFHDNGAGGTENVTNENANEMKWKKKENPQRETNEEMKETEGKLVAGLEGKEEQEEQEEELSLDLDELTPEVMEYARRELGETDEVKCQTLQELREMIYERGECSPHRMDDAFLIRFLRARNFNVNRAHRLIVRYCDFKEDNPDIHQGVNPLKMRHIGDDDAVTVPGYRTKCGRRMMIYRIGNWDPKKYGIEELFKATVIILELGILEPRAQVLGGVVIFDLEGITMAHAWTITPQIAGMVMALMVSAFPMKTHAIHILHQSWIFDIIFAMFRPLLDANMQGRIFFHGDDTASLHRHVGINNLPKKYGGTRDELPYYKWIDALSTKPKIVKEMYQLGYVVPEEMLHMIRDPIM